MNENIQIKELLEKLEAQGLVKKTEGSANLIKYSFVNNTKRNLAGVAVLSPNFDMFYMAFAGLTNKYFASGERLEIEDIEKFVKGAVDGPVVYSNGHFGRQTISIQDIVLNEKIDQ